jgi:hypothetical protein
VEDREAIERQNPRVEDRSPPYRLARRVVDDRDFPLRQDVQETESSSGFDLERRVKRETRAARFKDEALLEVVELFPVLLEVGESGRLFRQGLLFGLLRIGSPREEAPRNEGRRKIRMLSQGNGAILAEKKFLPRDTKQIFPVPPQGVTEELACEAVIRSPEPPPGEVCRRQRRRSRRQVL